MKVFHAFGVFLGRTLGQVSQHGLVGRACDQELLHSGGGSALSLTGSDVRKPVRCVPYIRTFKLQTFKDADVHSHVQSCGLVDMSGVHCHVRASSTSGCAFVYFTVKDCREYSSTVCLFQVQDVWKQV